MDLAPFSLIDPCGYPGLAVTQTKAIGMNETLSTLGERLAVLLAEKIEHA
jgi:lipoyl(octanoyl) transferase